VSRLGVEQIIVSADIKKKREYIRKNLTAWLKKPDLGMVPLLMAGDKEFYYYFHEIRKQTGVKLFIFSGGHEIEETSFKYGFCGVDHGVNTVMNCLTGISRMHKLKMLWYFAKQYITNPAYINSSIFDTLYAYYCTYFLKDDYLYLYHFIEWDEKTIISTIRKKFDWELAQDTNATWRTDDGTAAFYNYIYLSMAGFTEFDNFRSYQVREGKLTRDEAMNLIKEENTPRFEAIEWYAEAVGIDINDAIGTINSAPKLYKITKS
jgi:glutamine---fructose-6-phosphate transaminase (isomerizing)